MSFWKGVKNAFGFGGSESEEDIEEYDSSLPTYAAKSNHSDHEPTHHQPDTVPQAQPQPDALASTAVTEQKNTEPTPKDADDSLPGDLFDALIEQFNATQPEFVRNCLSTEAQRQYIYNSISEKLRARIQKATSPDNEPADPNELTETNRLRRRIANLESETKKTETLRQENRNLQLSIKRQKRALLDRINDLEAQAAKNYAEREKFFSDKRNPADAALIDSTNARVKELEEILAKRDEETAKLNEALAARDNDIAKRDEEIAARATDIEQMMMKIKIGDQMINDLRNQSAAARNEYEDTCNQQQLALEQIQHQVEAFEQIKTKYEARIAELKDSLKQEKSRNLDEQIARLNEENTSLRHTIENNLYNQASNEMRLRNEIKQLKKELEKASAVTISASPQDTSYGSSAEASPASYLSATATDEEAQSAQKQPARRRGRPKKAKLDEDLDNTDWFSQGGTKDDPDFGYHEPPRRPSNDNAAQLSLF